MYFKSIFFSTWLVVADLKSIEVPKRFPMSTVRFCSEPCFLISLGQKLFKCFSAHLKTSSVSVLHMHSQFSLCMSRFIGVYVSPSSSRIFELAYMT